MAVTHTDRAKGPDMLYRLLAARDTAQVVVDPGVVDRAPFSRPYGDELFEYRLHLEVDDQGVITLDPGDKRPKMDKITMIAAFLEDECGGSWVRCTLLAHNGKSWIATNYKMARIGGPGRNASAYLRMFMACSELEDLTLKLVDYLIEDLSETGGAPWLSDTGGASWL